MEKKWLYMWENPFISLPKVLLLYFVALVCVIFKTHGVCVVYGIPLEQFETGLDFVVFGKWMFMMAIPLIASGGIFENGSKIRIYCELRMKRKKNFRLWIAGTSAAVTVLWTVILALAAGIIDGFGFSISLFGVLASNFLMWNAIWQFLLWNMPMTTYAGALILALQGGSCLCGQYFPQFLFFLPSAWGMYTLAYQDSIVKVLILNLLVTVTVTAMLMMDNKE